MTIHPVETVANSSLRKTPSITASYKPRSDAERQDQAAGDESILRARNSGSLGEQTPFVVHAPIEGPIEYVERENNIRSARLGWRKRDGINSANRCEVRASCEPSRSLTFDTAKSRTRRGKSPQATRHR